MVLSDSFDSDSVLKFDADLFGFTKVDEYTKGSLHLRLPVTSIFRYCNI